MPFVLIAGSLVVAFAAFHPNLTPATHAEHIKIVIVALAGSGFGLGYRALAAHGDSVAMRRVVALGVVPLWMLAVLVPPYDSVDPHTYASIGRSQVEYGSNPYASVVSGIPEWRIDPLLRDDQYADVPFAYGFLFAREAAIAVRHFGPEKLDIFLVFKLVNAAALALTLWIVYSGCARVGLSRATGLYLAGWNPIALLHGLSNFHNDILSGLALAAALALAGSRLWWGCLSVLAAGAMIKYSTLPLVPIALLYLARSRGWTRVALSALPAAALVAWAARPYAGDGAEQLMKSLSNVTHAHGSIASIPVELARALRPGAERVVGDVWKLIAGCSVVGLVGWLMLTRWRQSEYVWKELVRDAVLVQAVLILVASPKFYSWYLLMFWPVVAWLPVESRLRRSAVAVGFAQSGSLMFLGGANIVNPLLMIVLPLEWARRRVLAERSNPIPFPSMNSAEGRKAA